MGAKLATAYSAARLIQDGNTITTGGFVGIGVPEELLKAVEQRFLETGTPTGLTVFFAAGQGDGHTRGLNRLGYDGLLARAIGGHWGLIPKVGSLALSGKIEAWNLPQGVISQMYREIAGGRRGVMTRTGLNTFVDPRVEGGKLNETTPDLVRLMEFDGEEQLFFPCQKLDVALLRATTADPEGNVSIEREALALDNLAMATATRNCGGLVIVQVERMCASGDIPPKSVAIPGALVDVLVLSEPENHMQTFSTPYSPYYAGEMRAPPGKKDRMTLDARKVIARRCALELPPGGVVNLGIGLPEGVAAVADEEGILNSVTLTAEPGILGGRPANGLDFGAATNASAVIPQNAQFDFYDGGGLDLAVLGMAEADAFGNVNVSKFGGRLAGAGGFINISQNAKKVVFAGTFTAGGLSVEIADRNLKILNEGKLPKFVPSVEQITFSAANAGKVGTEVMYVTERAVFALSDAQMKLIEIAPGADLQRDILDLIDFVPDIENIREMNPALFDEESFGLEDILFDMALSERIVFDEARNQLFLNFERLKIRTLEDISEIERHVLGLIGEMRERVDVIANYNQFDIPSELEPIYASMVGRLEREYYGTVSRYTSNAFMRQKLERAFARTSAPHLFETGEEARRFLMSARKHSN